MGFKDLRSFLAKLEQEKQLVHYRDLIQPSPDIGRISRAVSNMGHNGPAVIFDNIAGYKGKKLVVGVHASWANHALSFDLPKETKIREQFFAVSEKWDKYPGEVTYIDSNKAPCHEVVYDKNINLYELLPLYRINNLDGGCYLSK
ncbi:MAG: UbiD family decarboxylase, partial [Acidaminococcales bacterium]|nr:UbiD family decarboxylase [Acidaminococcales bacterium]